MSIQENKGKKSGWSSLFGKREDPLSLSASRALQQQRPPRGMGTEGPGGEMAVARKEIDIFDGLGGAEEVDVKRLVDEIIEVAQSNNEKSDLLSQIVDQMLEDFKKNIDTLEQSKTEAEKATDLAVIANNQLRDEKSRLETDKQAEIAILSEQLRKNVSELADQEESMRLKTMDYTTHVASLKASCDMLSGLCSDKDQNLVESAEKITRLEGDLKALNAVGKQKDEEIESIERARDQAVQQHTAAINQLRDELASATVDSAAKQEQLKAAQEAVDNLQQRLTAEGEARNAASQENSRIRSENEQLLVQIREKDVNVAELERSARAADLAAKKANAEVTSEKAKCTQMAAEIKKLEGALQTMKDSGAKLGSIGDKIGTDPNANASKETKRLLADMDKLNKRIKSSTTPPQLRRFPDSTGEASIGGRKKTRKKKNKKKRNSTKRIVFKTKKQNKKTRIKKVKKMNRKPAKKMTRRRK